MGKEKTQGNHVELESKGKTLLLPLLFWYSELHSKLVFISFNCRDTTTNAFAGLLLGKRCFFACSHRLYIIPNLSNISKMHIFRKNKKHRNKSNYCKLQCRHDSGPWRLKMMAYN